jgi:hypothetical protein
MILLPSHVEGLEALILGPLSLPELVFLVCVVEMLFPGVMPQSTLATRRLPRVPVTHISGVSPGGGTALSLTTFL